MLLGGMRFDASILIIANGLLIVSALLPFKYRFSNAFFKIYRFLFVVFNGAALALNLVDVAYVSFTRKRSSFDLFTTQGLGNDVWNLIPEFAKDYWYLLFILVVLLYILYKGVKPMQKTVTRWWVQSIILIFVLGLGVLAQRGGLQVKPLMLLHASNYTTSDKAAVVLNTPFSIIRTIGNKKLQELHYFEQDELKTYFSPIKKSTRQLGKGDKPNICLIILESFSQEYIGGLTGKKTYTPFIDSLLNKSLVFTNAFANGQRSIEALPTLLTSIPTLMDQPFITSTYSSNNIKGIGTILKDIGYQTSFFHGGENGTMGFNVFSKSAGFDAYYGKNEYQGEPDDDDGHWGIFDEPFLQFMSDQLSKVKEPFASVLFTVSSHHPFIIPAKYQDRFVEEELPIHKSVRYTDFALQQFFEKAKHEPWFDNTLFVITADHTSLSKFPKYYYMHSGTFRVPLLFYSPKLIEPEINATLAQHIDIMPTVLDFVGYQKPFYAFGESLLKDLRGRAVANWKSNMWQIQNDSMLVRFDGEQVTDVFYLPNDSACRETLIKVDSIPDYQPLLNTLKAQIQTFNADLLKNNMTINE